MITTKHLLPHGRKRKKHEKPDTLMVHAMGEFIGDYHSSRFASAFLMHEQLSAHYLVTPSGVVIECRRPDVEVAWHAGPDYNARAIGVEFLVAGVYANARDLFDRINAGPYLTSAQYDAGVELGQKLLLQFPSITQILQHSDVNAAKEDPGSAFPWSRFTEDVRTCRLTEPTL